MANNFFLEESYKPKYEQYNNQPSYNHFNTKSSNFAETYDSQPFDLNDINNILEECDNENQNEKRASAEIKKYKELNLRTTALKVQLHNTNKEQNQIKQKRKHYES